MDSMDSMEEMEEILNRPVIVYTDGGCSGNPGPGGWGAVIITGGTQVTLSGGAPKTTNNRMELTAAISALRAVRFGTMRIEMFCDSQYVKNGITEWIKTWKQNGWKTSAKKRVLNRDLWEELDCLASNLDIEWHWVKGHSGVEYNEICDELCQKEIARYR